MVERFAVVSKFPIFAPQSILINAQHMRKFLTIFTLSLLAVSCIDNDYDLSDIDTDDIGIGD